MNKEKFIEGLQSDISFTEEERDEILKKNAYKTGQIINTFIAAEELAELQIALSKHFRNHGDTYEILEEMADVYITLRVLGLTFDISNDAFQKAIDVKLKRVKERLG